jgi:hypothetical protein
MMKKQKTIGNSGSKSANRSTFAKAAEQSLLPSINPYNSMIYDT